MQNLFVPFLLAQQLKEKGFNEPCFTTWYTSTGKTKDGKLLDFKSNPQSQNYIGHKNEYTMNGDCTAPLYQQVIDWLREEKKINIHAQLYGNSFKQMWIPTVVRGLNPNNTIEFDYCNEYYEALTKAIEEAIKLI